LRRQFPRAHLPAGRQPRHALQLHAANALGLENDGFAQIEETYAKYGYGRSNLRYGYVSKPLA